ncbi:putative ADP-ribosylation factor [Senna tora]|uniref:Putative ADP-ribosylation factor n=1 Tax=Senna tora TaxID=362788 RepID=A0A834TVM8_9FABA|nr:putative ADP-ribosylation factor [Senna tora]
MADFWMRILSGLEKVKYKKITFYAWDIEGKYKIGPIWRHQLLMASHRDYDALVHTKISILANKNDLPGAMNKAEIADRLNLEVISQPWMNAVRSGTPFLKPRVNIF